MIEIPPYSQFASIYDDFMDHVNFDTWANFIIDSWLEETYPKNILDLGCGVGKLLSFLSKSIPKQTGIDGSNEMLKVARKIHPNAFYIHGDIKQFSLKEKFSLVTCTHDTLNYILNEDCLRKHFESVNKNMNIGGYYFFDLSSEYNLLNNFHKKNIYHNTNTLQLFWKNYYNQKRKIITSTLVFSVYDDSRLKRYKETHYQKYHEHSKIKKILRNTGFALESVGSDYKSWKVEKDSCLINYMVRKIEELK